ncbi:hypothetical protein BI347_17995 [Chromobacterium sphagni]|uniref:Toxin-antitoxin system YwqK family antitoxin n=1 Tax=Chromobacterium sphagni TaxID=1903179 RepID=A0A1S1WW66_9NEIS|nr:hypothetical protein BI347_17995 [Chromobacterium sphagni]
MLEYRNAEIVNGKLYASGANEPFNGKVTNVPEDKIMPSIILPSKDGLYPVLQAAENVLKIGAAYLGLGLMCDITVHDGLPDGEASCQRSGTSKTVVKAHFSGGVLEGDFVALDDSDNPMFTVSFNRGQADGKLEIFSPHTHKLRYHVNFEHGTPVGSEEAFNENSGVLVGRAEYENGKLQGEVVRYADDGKRVIYRAHYVEGTPEGVEESFDPNTGQVTSYAIWEHGVQTTTLSGDEAIQAHNGKSLSEITHPSTSTISSADVDACQQAWMTAFRKEQGDTAIVTQDQMTEWEEQCRQGKRPA